ncbi:MAG TPA: GIY-YIG nuclease family protein [Kofleriaceae bacterium]|nr:GIY-YIG nuclease family protein [Kofleriaceae bacterium]
MARAAGSAWFVYLARCADGTLYCGIARDVAARIAQHDAGTGAKYTRSRGPLAVLLVRRCRDQGTALRLERAIKQLPRADKLRLAEAPARVAALVRALRPRARARAQAQSIGHTAPRARAEHPRRRSPRLDRGRRAAP